MGEVEVPADAYYGASTQRAVLNFPISGQTFPRGFIRALGLIKKSAAETNHELGLQLWATGNADAMILATTLLDPARWLIGHRHYPRGQVLDLVRAAGLDPVLAQTRGRWSDVVGLPLLYATTRLGLPMPAKSWFHRWANREYGQAGRYTHFVVARKP